MHFRASACVKSAMFEDAILPEHAAAYVAEFSIGFVLTAEERGSKDVRYRLAAVLVAFG